MRKEKIYKHIDSCQYVMKEAQDIFKALSDLTRLKIVIFLLNGEKCVCEIFPHLKRTQSTTSIQLKKLEEWNIVESRRDGKRIFYRIKKTKICDILKVVGVKGEYQCRKKKK